MRWIKFFLSPNPKQNFLPFLFISSEFPLSSPANYHINISSKSFLFVFPSAVCYYFFFFLVNSLLLFPYIIFFYWIFISLLSYRNNEHQYKSRFGNLYNIYDIFPYFHIEMIASIHTSVCAKFFLFCIFKTYFFYFKYLFLQNTYMSLFIIHIYSNKIF